MSNLAETGLDTTGQALFLTRVFIDLDSVVEICDWLSSAGDMDISEFSQRDFDSCNWINSHVDEENCSSTLIQLETMISDLSLQLEDLSTQVAKCVPSVELEIDRVSTEAVRITDTLDDILSPGPSSSPEPESDLSHLILLNQMKEHALTALEAFTEADRLKSSLRSLSLAFSPSVARTPSWIDSVSEDISSLQRSLGVIGPLLSESERAELPDVEEYKNVLQQTVVSQFGASMRRAVGRWVVAGNQAAVGGTGFSSFGREVAPDHQGMAELERHFVVLSRIGRFEKVVRLYVGEKLVAEVGERMLLSVEALQHFLSQSVSVVQLELSFLDSVLRRLFTERLSSPSSSSSSSSSSADWSGSLLRSYAVAVIDEVVEFSRVRIADFLDRVSGTNLLAVLRTLELCQGFVVEMNHLCSKFGPREEEDLVSLRGLEDGLFSSLRDHYSDLEEQHLKVSVVALLDQVFPAPDPSIRQSRDQHSHHLEMLFSEFDFLVASFFSSLFESIPRCRSFTAGMSFSSLLLVFNRLIRVFLTQLETRLRKSLPVALDVPREDFRIVLSSLPTTPMIHSLRLLGISSVFSRHFAEFLENVHQALLPDRAIVQQRLRDLEGRRLRDGSSHRQVQAWTNSVQLLVTMESEKDSQHLSVFADATETKNHFHAFCESCVFFSLFQNVRVQFGDFVRNKRWKLSEGAQSGEIRDYMMQVSEHLSALPELIAGEMTMNQELDETKDWISEICSATRDLLRTMIRRSIASLTLSESQQFGVDLRHLATILRILQQREESDEIHFLSEVFSVATLEEFRNLRSRSTLDSALMQRIGDIRRMTGRM